MKIIILLVLLLAAPAAAQSNLKADLDAARGHYSARNMTAAEQAALLNEVAWKNRADGWGLLAKPSGNNCPLPISGLRVSCDYLVFAPTGQGFDVLRDAEGAGEVTWDPKEAFDRSRWVAPVGTPPPPPILEPPVVDPPPPSSAVLEELRALGARIAVMAATLDRLQQQLDAIAARPIQFPPYTGRIFGQPFTLTPK